jgi:hypothetical protein
LPIISTFFGIIVRMFFDDHAPPHFHAEHAGRRQRSIFPVGFWLERFVLRLREP